MSHLVHCRHCDYRGPVLYAHPGVPPWSILLGCTGIGLVGMLLAVVLLGHSTRRTCPQCGSYEHLEPGEPPVDPAAIELHRQAVARDAAKHAANLRQTWLALGLLGSAFASAAVLAWLKWRG